MRVRDLNEALLDKGHPYYIDADLYSLQGTLSPILLSFYAQERGSYTSSGKEISVLRLWRLDHLNVAQSKLGYTRPASPHAIVLLDNVEHDLVTQILPAVPDGEIMSLTDEDTSLSQREWVADIQEKGGEVIRKHYASLPPELTTKARRLGELLALRRSILARWKKNLGSEHGFLTMPRRLIPEADYTAELNIRVSASDRVDWDNLHGDLTSAGSIADFEEVREAYIRSVERHEVQHRLDYGAEHIELPELLAQRMGVERMGHSPHSLPYRAGLELSAYLSQVADDPAPRLALMTMSRLFLNKYTIRSAHGFAGLVALEAMAKHLEIGRDAILGRVVTRPELARLLAQVCDRPMTDVKAAARKAYVDLFGAELPRVQRQTFQSQPAWRH